MMTNRRTERRSCLSSNIMAGESQPGPIRLSGITVMPNYTNGTPGSPLVCGALVQLAPSLMSVHEKYNKRRGEGPHAIKYDGSGHVLRRGRSYRCAERILCCSAEVSVSFYKLLGQNGRQRMVGRTSFEMKGTDRRAGRRRG